MSEQYFFVRKLGIGKDVVSLSLVVTEASRGGEMRWWRQEVGLQPPVRLQFDHDVTTRCLHWGLNRQTVQWDCATAASGSAATDATLVSK